jgi:uncharacterized protein (TIGR03435 family)
MFRAMVGAATFLAAACAAFAQAASGLPSFEVASVKRSPPPGPDQQSFTVTMDDRRPGLVTYRNVILKSLLETAYDLEGYQIKGPNWIDSEQFDIVARVPADTPYAQRRLMLQRLLAERLRLQAHLEKRDLPAYVLLVGKSPPTLRRAKVRTIGDDGTIEGSGIGGGKLNAMNQTMQGLATLLSYELHAPVVDGTGINGEYDLVLTWGLDASSGAATDELVAESVAIALRREAGLILKKQKASVDFLVIDQVEKVPAEN